MWLKKEIESTREPSKVNDYIFVTATFDLPDEFAIITWEYVLP